MVCWLLVNRVLTSRIPTSPFEQTLPSGEAPPKTKLWVHYKATVMEMYLVSCPCICSFGINFITFAIFCCTRNKVSLTKNSFKKFLRHFFFFLCVADLAVDAVIRGSRSSYHCSQLLCRTVCVSSCAASDQVMGQILHKTYMSSKPIVSLGGNSRSPHAVTVTFCSCVCTSCCNRNRQENGYVQQIVTEIIIFFCREIYKL